MHVDTLQRQLRERGFTVVRNLISRTELDQLATDLAALDPAAWRECDTGRHLPNAAASCPSLAWLFCHPGILGAVRAALGRDDVVFTGNCDLHRDKLGSWHKDLGHVHGGYLRSEDEASEACRIVKIGVYLQDHDTDRRGFHVRERSHVDPAAEHSAPRYVPTRAGDVLVFDPRLSHCGMPPDPVERVIWRAARALGRDGDHTSPLGRHAKSLYWTLRGRETKQSVFFTYGAPTELTEDFARGIQRALAPEDRPAVGESWLPGALVEALGRRGVGTC